MKKRKIFRMIALLLSLTLLFSACSLGRSPAEESPPEEKNAAAQIVRKTICEMGSNISIEASYPETKAAGVDNIILSEIRQAIDDFRKSVGKQGGSLRINYEIYPGEGAIFSACYTLQATIGENKTESGFARTYNTAEDGVYAIKDFFPADGTAYLSLLSDTVRKNAKSSGIPADNARFEAGTKADAGLYSSFILAQDKLIFVFPSGQIADYSAKVEVPLSVFGDSFQIGEASVKEPEQLGEVEFIPVDGHFTTTTLPQEETTEQTTEETTADNQTTTEAVSETTSGTTAETTTKKPDNGPKKIALTFDDGPGPYTDEIIRALKECNAKATFFMVGTSAKAYPEQVKHVYEAGCEIGNHTYSHENLKKLTADEVRSQLKGLDDLVEKLTGQRPTLLRPPGGNVNKTVGEMVDRPFILWNVDTLDWKKRDADYVYNYVMEKVAKGDIILMHDIHKTSAQAAVRLIHSLTEQGYELVTISELFDAYGPELKSGKSYSFVKGSTWK